uniref:Uncharacterized protein n=1 Tax=Anguilla anguilla TaxID=7936 RepID=A0A0E9QA29_ANGAN
MVSPAPYVWGLGNRDTGCRSTLFQ